MSWEPVKDSAGNKMRWHRDTPDGPGTREYRTTDYCAQCGESPDSGTHLFKHTYVPPNGTAAHRKDPLGGSSPATFVAHALCEMNNDERQVLAEIAAGIVRGRHLYGPLNAIQSLKDWPAEASEEARDLATYLAFEVVRRQRIRERNGQ